MAPAVSFCRAAPLSRGKTREIFSCRGIPRNPLISLDSDERIQGNPRESNPQIRALCNETATNPENPNGSTGSPQQLLQMRDERRVRGRHRVGSQVLRPHPFERLPIERLNEALPPAADVERQKSGALESFPSSKQATLAGWPKPSPLAPSLGLCQS
jgi:hypothetical protein